MKTDLLSNRHIGIEEKDMEHMLNTIGVKSLDELINQNNSFKYSIEETSKSSCSDDGTSFYRTHLQTRSKE